MWGSCVVIVLLMLIALECISIARTAKDTSGMIIASGMAAVIGFQRFYEHCGNHNDYAEHRNPAALCKQWADISCQFVYRYGICTECAIAEKKLYTSIGEGCYEYCIDCA